MSKFSKFVQRSARIIRGNTRFLERAAGYARPKKFPREIGKIGSTLALQDICRKFRMPFETAVPFNDVSKFDARQFIDSDSIIVRTEDRRKEFVIADKNLFLK